MLHKYLVIRGKFKILHIWELGVGWQMLSMCMLVSVQMKQDW